MKNQLGRIMLAAAATAIIVTGCGKKPDWSSHDHWPEKYEFQGKTVQYHIEYLSGDEQVPLAQPGQKPAMFKTYYTYVKDGQEIRHGKFTTWYSRGKPKAETTYVDGKRGNRTFWYENGVVAERTTTTSDGERTEFFDRRGRELGVQTFDNRTGKLICILRGRAVTLDIFMAEIGKTVYGRTRITP